MWVLFVTIVIMACAAVSLATVAYAVWDMSGCERSQGCWESKGEH